MIIYDPPIVISLADLKSYEETAHLMSSFKNADRLNQAVQELENNRGQIKGWVKNKNLRGLKMRGMTIWSGKNKIK